MSARIPPGFAEAWAQFGVTGDAEPMYVSLGLDLASGVTASVTVADTILIVMHGDLRQLVSDDYTLGPGYVIFGNDGGDVRIDGTQAAVAGAETGNANPPNVSLLTRKITASGGRRARGRMFTPGVPVTGMAANGVLNTATRNQYQAEVDILETDLLALADVEGIVLFHDSAPFTPTPVTGFEVSDRLATQRRRLRP